MSSRAPIENEESNDGSTVEPILLKEDRKLEKAIQNWEKELRHRLTPPSWWRFWKRNDPELIKVLGLIHSRLSELSRLLIVRESSPPPDFLNIRYRLNQMMEECNPQFSINSAWEFSDSLRRMLLLLGDDSYLLAHLVNEKKNSADENPSLTWKKFLDEGRLDALLRVYQSNQPVATAQHTRAVEYLSLVYSARSNSGRHHRAVMTLRERYLNRLASTLIILLLLLVLGIFIVANPNFQIQPVYNPLRILRALWNFPSQYLLNDPQVRLFIVAALAGGIGSVLSGFFKLRDEVVGIHDLRSFKAAMRAQPFVGATIGVLLYLLIAGGIFGPGVVKIDVLNAGAAPWPLIGIYSFFAGFSEPFFLGVVQRVAGAASKQGESRNGNTVSKS